MRQVTKTALLSDWDLYGKPVSTKIRTLRVMSQKDPVTVMTTSSYIQRACKVEDVFYAH